MPIKIVKTNDAKTKKECIATKIEKECVATENEKERIFSLEIYQNRVEKQIHKMFRIKANDTLIKDILLDEYIGANKISFDITKRIKQVQMKIGNIWQILIGEYKDFQNLKIGHVTGLDAISEKRKIVMEIKNRYNTDNSSARKSNYDKLSNYKHDHPDFECIYGVINDTKDCVKAINHNNQEIKYYSGRYLLDYVFGNDKENVLKIINAVLKKIPYLNTACRYSAFYRNKSQ